jgi:MFS family permease
MVRRIVDAPTDRARRPGIAGPRVILGLFTALNLLNYLDRMVLPAVLAPVRDDLQLSHSMSGSLGTLFLIGYFMVSPVFGTLGDRAATGGRTRLIALGIAVWSAATVASGLAQNAGQMIAARIFVGFGEASYATLAPTIIDDLAPPERKSAWMGIFYSATPIGSALGYLVGGAVLHASGWRAAFFVAGAPGLLIAILCLFVVEPHRQAPPVERGALVRAAKELSGVPLYVGTVLGYAVYTFAIGGFAYWAPAYIHERYGMDAGKASFVFGMVTVVAGAVGTLFGGFIADRRVRARLARLGPSPDADPRAIDDVTARGNLDVPILGSLIGAPLAALAIACSSAAAFFGANLPAEVALFLSSGPINVAILRSSPPALRASAMAISIFAIHALGDLWSPWLIGLVADAGGGSASTLQLAMFIAVPLVFGLSALVWWRAVSRSRRLT